MIADSSEPADLVEPQGVNAGSPRAERDRRPDGVVPASSSVEIIPPPHPAADELVGLPGQTADEPGQQLEAGEG